MSTSRKNEPVQEADDTGAGGITSGPVNDDGNSNTEEQLNVSDVEEHGPRYATRSVTARERKRANSDDDSTYYATPYHERAAASEASGKRRRKSARLSEKRSSN